MSRFGNETVKTPTGHIEIAPLEYIKELNYDEAVLYCTFLDVEGTKGWRLPTYEEAMCIYLGEVGHLLPPSERYCYKYYDGYEEVECTSRPPYDIFGNSNSTVRRDYHLDDEDDILQAEQPKFWTSTLYYDDSDEYNVCPLLVDNKRDRRRWSWLYEKYATTYTQPVRSIAKPNRYSNTIRKQREYSLLNARWEALSKKRRLQWEDEKNELIRERDAYKNYIIEKEGNISLRLLIDTLDTDDFL